jgi:chromosome segregation ATPase
LEKKSAELAAAKDKKRERREQLELSQQEAERLKETVQGLEEHKKRKDAELADLALRLQSAEDRAKGLAQELAAASQRAESSERKVVALEADVCAKDDELHHLHVPLSSFFFCGEYLFIYLFIYIYTN